MSMDIDILVADVPSGHRRLTSVHSHATRIPLVNRTKWIGGPAIYGVEFYSLTHTPTGRAINQVPLTEKECSMLVDALMDCPIEWARIDAFTEWPGRKWFADRLTPEAEQLACGTGRGLDRGTGRGR